MNRASRFPGLLAAALLPLAGLAALWGASDRTYNSGTEWDVPIQGYDPRDYLRGHYVEFSYDWPGIGEFSGPPPGALCLEGAAPALARAVPTAADTPCSHPVRAQQNGVYGGDGLTRGRLYIGQDRAARLEAQLRGRDQRAIVTIRQRNDGSFTPIGIRFRALTPAEIAERDIPNEGAADLRPPPPIMAQ